MRRRCKIDVGWCKMKAVNGAGNGTWQRLQRPLIVLLAWVLIALALIYVVYRWVDPLPPRRLTIAVGGAGSVYDDFAKQYARILARNGVTLNIRTTAGALENLDLLRNPASGVQAALSTFGFNQPSDTDSLDSLGGIFDGPIFIFYRGPEPITELSQFRGKRIAIGLPRTAVRALMTEVLRATGASASSNQIVDLDNTQAVDALIAGNIDAAIFTSELESELLRRAFGDADLRLMNVTQAEAIAKTVPGLQHVILWRGLVSLSKDIPSSDANLLAVRNRVLVRKDLHPALQYLLLEAMREVHSPQGPFSRIGEFPAKQPNDLPLSPTAEAFYRSGPTFWQRYTSFWLASLVSRILFFVIPVIALLIPVISTVPRVYKWLSLRRIDNIHRALGNLEREIAQSPEELRNYAARISEIESDVRMLKVARPFEVDLQRLRIHLRMVQEDIAQLEAGTRGAAT